MHVLFMNFSNILGGLDSCLDLQGVEFELGGLIK